MPEGDTVHALAERLRAAQLGDIVRSSDFRTPSTAMTDLAGHRIDGIEAYGKHLIHYVGPFLVHSHLRMDGQWQFIPTGRVDRWRRPGWAARIILTTERGVALGFDLGELDVAPRDQHEHLVGHLGPDPLRDDWNAAKAALRVVRDAERGVPAAVALADQRNIAGLGLEYVTEILFLAGIDPRRPILDHAEADRVVSLAARTIQANRSRPRRVFTGIDRRGERTWVFGRAGRDCRRCGTRLDVATIGARPEWSRGVVWCPTHQPMADSMAVRRPE